MAVLSTSWLGFHLQSPIVVAASPLSRHPDAIQRAVDAGAGAVVMHSLFEEQLVQEQMAAHRYFDAQVDLDAETQGIGPGRQAFSMDVAPYLRELLDLKKRVSVPILASLNGVTPGGWTSYAKKLADAGADALELNLYEVVTSPEATGTEVEHRQLDVVASVVHAVSIPITVKLSPYYSSLPSFVRRLEKVGARGVAVFNRFYQPDVDLDALDVDRHLHPSTSAELPLRLHALALLSPWTTLTLSCTGGVHSGRDAAKAILSGAHGVQLASALLERGPRFVATILEELGHWLDERGYTSSTEARGVLNLGSTPDPHAWERLNYVKVLEGWRPRSLDSL